MPDRVEPSLKSPRTTVKSADRALDLLELVAAAGGHVSFMQAVQALGIPKSSLFQLVQNLHDRGYLHQVAGGYTLGPSIAKLAKGVAPLPLPILVTPCLQKLTADLNESSAFYVRRGGWTETVATASGVQALAFTLQIGEKAPLHAAAPGKVVLAHMAEREAERYLGHARLAKMTENTITAPSRLRRELDRIREEGFAVSNQEFYRGVVGVATVVASSGVLFGAVGVVLPAARFDPDRLPSLRDRLLKAAVSIGSTLQSYGLSPDEEPPEAES